MTLGRPQILFTPDRYPSFLSSPTLYIFAACLSPLPLLSVLFFYSWSVAVFRHPFFTIYTLLWTDIVFFV